MSRSTLNATLESTAEERAEIRAGPETSGQNIGPVWSRIPNWVGAEMAA